LHWIDKNIDGGMVLGDNSVVYDIGCGNGRNLMYLAQEFGVSGYGFDISREAIDTAVYNSKNLDLNFSIKALNGSIDMPDNSVDLVLDMMVSHFLEAAERDKLRTEIARVLKPGGWLFYKTFLLDNDRNAKKLLREYPAGEDGSYVHPKMGVLEHVSTEDEIKEKYGEYFILHRVLKSHKHLRNGRAYKRRSVSVYAQLK
jgi:SAM-dependent methyltransferase